jgi:hypothetical protein
MRQRPIPPHGGIGVFGRRETQLTRTRTNGIVAP